MVIDVLAVGCAQLRHSTQLSHGNHRDRFLIATPPQGPAVTRSSGKLSADKCGYLITPLAMGSRQHLAYATVFDAGQGCSFSEHLCLRSSGIGAPCRNARLITSARLLFPVEVAALEVSSGLSYFDSQDPPRIDRLSALLSELTSLRQLAGGGRIPRRPNEVLACS